MLPNSACCSVFFKPIALVLLPTLPAMAKFMVEKCCSSTLCRCYPSAALACCLLIMFSSAMSQLCCGVGGTKNKTQKYAAEKNT